MTAVEWFADRIKHGGLVSKKQFDELLEQANEMFEKQMFEYIKKHYVIGENTLKFHQEQFEKYYNKTFKSE